MKTCSKCLRELPEEDFHKNPSAPSGRNSRCRECIQHAHRMKRLGAKVDEHIASLKKENKISNEAIAAISECILARHVLMARHPHDFHDMLIKARESVSPIIDFAFRPLPKDAPPSELTDQQLLFKAVIAHIVAPLHGIVLPKKRRGY